MLDDNLLLYGPQIVMYYLYVYDAVESGIKQFNWKTAILKTVGHTQIHQIYKPFII